MGMPSLERQPSISRTNARRLGIMVTYGGWRGEKGEEGKKEGNTTRDFPPLHPSNFGNPGFSGGSSLS